MSGVSASASAGHLQSARHQRAATDSVVSPPSTSSNNNTGAPTHGRINSEFIISGSPSSPDLAGSPIVAGGGRQQGAGFPSGQPPPGYRRKTVVQQQPGGGGPSPPSGTAGKLSPKFNSSPMFPADPLPPLTLGDHFTVQAKAATLREFLGDSYWSSWMEQVCDGKLVGVAVRYTGENMVLMQFRDMSKISKKGKRYPFSLSLPQEYLVPIPPEQLRRTGSKMGGKGPAYSKEGALPFEGISCVPEMSAGYHHDGPESNGISNGSDVQKKMCVVCGAVGQQGEVRQSGFKCSKCVGKSSDKKLRDEASRQNLNGSTQPSK